jgi:hypothetical protein
MEEAEERSAAQRAIPVEEIAPGPLEEKICEIAEVCEVCKFAAEAEEASAAEPEAVPAQKIAREVRTE